MRRGGGMRPSWTSVRNLLAETPIAVAASASPRPNTTGKYGMMSARAVTRFIILHDEFNDNFGSASLSLGRCWLLSALDLSHFYWGFENFSSKLE